MSKSPGGRKSDGETRTVVFDLPARDWEIFVEALGSAGFELVGEPGGQELRCRRSAALIAATGAGVAHEVSGPLTAVLANLELALKTLDSAGMGGGGRASPPLAAPPAWVPELRAELADAHEAARNVHELVRAVKVFGRPDTEAARPVDLAEVVEMALRLAASALRPRARLVRQIGAMPPVAGSAVRLGQVVLNLLANAAQACDVEGGSLAREIRITTGTDENGWARIAIADNGVGIPQANLARVFEPYFSTKVAGQGTGLGLPISLRIVEDLGGRLALTSQEGAGTTVTVVLPPAPRR